MRNLLQLAAGGRDKLAAGDRRAFACAVTRRILEVYWTLVQRAYRQPWPLPALDFEEPLPALVDPLSSAAEGFGAAVARSEPISAGHLIGEIYTALLPGEFRATHGVFYTPPPLVARLLHLATEAGANWATDQILDPACGGGAFLAPVALRIVAARRQEPPHVVLEHIATHLQGFELDPFGAWMSQVLVESALIDLCRRAGSRLPRLARVCDALEASPSAEGVDLTIGNPPFGRITLPPELRSRYQRSLHGHANAYGLFMDLAVRWTRPGGTIAYITPTGFLGGRYFKQLRSLMAREAPPVTIDLVTSRKQVFSNVLQETLLATYRRGGRVGRAEVNLLSLSSESCLEVSAAGRFSLPAEATDP